MQYQKPLDLWGKGIQDGIVAGRIKIQCGQWVYCGNPNHKARYVGHSDRGIFNVVHWQGSAEATNKAFINRAEMQRIHHADRRT